MYIAYIGWSAISSLPQSQCNPFTVSKGNTFAEIFVGIGFTFISLFIISAISQSPKAEGRMGEKAKSVLAEDEEQSDPKNLENI